MNDKLSLSDCSGLKGVKLAARTTLESMSVTNKLAANDKIANTILE